MLSQARHQITERVLKERTRVVSPIGRLEARSPSLGLAGTKAEAPHGGNRVQQVSVSGAR